MIGYVYKYTNNFNDKVYIGKTYRLKKRQIEHKHSGSNSYFHRALKKYGYENFTFSIVAVTDNDDTLNFLERYYIKKYKSNTLEFGYNLTDGGESSVGYKHTDDTKKKIGLIHKDKKVSDETRKKISESRKLLFTNGTLSLKGNHNPNWKGGIKTKKELVPREVINKHISEATKGRIPWNKGKQMSEEARKKMSEKRKLYHQNKKNDKLCCA